MYTSINFKTKKELKDAIKEGKYITVFQPNAISVAETQNGKCYLEGPHYPQPHRWYGEGMLQNGRLISVK